MWIGVGIITTSKSSGAPDSDFHYCAGYLICWIIKENPARYPNIQFKIAYWWINKPFGVLLKFIPCMHNCLSYTVVIVIGYYTFCCSLPENILSLMPTSNSLMQKYIHFIQLTFTSINLQPFPSKSILYCQQTTINTILLYIRDSKI